MAEPNSPWQIPVQPEPFTRGLPNLAKALDGSGPVTIVALGSSTTAGEGNIPAYPERLEAMLQAQYPRVRVVNAGKGGEEAPQEFDRLDRDVLSQRPSLVIWQVGTNAVWQGTDQNHQSVRETQSAIRSGLQRMAAVPGLDVILMDLQYVPALLTPDKLSEGERMVDFIARAGELANVNVFRRYAMMKAWHEVEQRSFDQIVDPGDPTRLHDSDWATQRLALSVNIVIAAALRL